MSLLLGSIYVLPVLLMLAGVIPPEFRFHVLLLLTAVSGLLVWLRRDRGALGFGSSTLRPVLAWTSLPLAAFALLDVSLGLAHSQPALPSAGFLLFFALISAPAQEFLYRSFLFAEFDAHGVESPAVKIVASSVLFAFMHVIYGDAATVGLTFAAGLVWGSAFQMTANFWVVAASHAALGAFALYRGII